jgi:hypothetical protein
VICDGRFGYVRSCWYRYFLEQAVSLPVRDATDLRRTCRNLRGVERFGCISAAALTISSNPFDQMRICLRLASRDAEACVRGVPDQALAGRPARQVALIRSCARIARAARADCYSWLGRTLAVVTNGAFLVRGCAKLRPNGRQACSAGARKMNAALVTFS